MGRVAALLFADGVSLRGDELNGDREFAFVRRHSDDFGWLRLIQRTGAGGIGERDVEHLALDVGWVRGDEKKAVTRNVDRCADLFEAGRRIRQLDAELSADLGATAPTTFDTGWA